MRSSRETARRLSLASVPLTEGAADARRISKVENARSLKAFIPSLPRCGSPRGQGWLAPSPRQARFSHQELVHRVGALAAFADRPYHQRLAAPHVASPQPLRVRGLIARRVRLNVVDRV